MKITKIEPMVVGAPTPGNGQLSNKNYIFVKVYTDEGVAGIGEASLGGYTNTIVALIGELEELLIGEDPTRIEYLCQVMQRQKFWRKYIYHAISCCTTSAIDSTSPFGSPDAASTISFHARPPIRYQSTPAVSLLPLNISTL